MNSSSLTSSANPALHHHSKTPHLSTLGQSLQQAAAINKHILMRNISPTTLQQSQVKQFN
jgi:hypothetical protein